MAEHAEHIDEGEVSAPETKRDRSARRWLDQIQDAEDAYQPWQDKCDKIDKRYADLEEMSGVSTDREFQIFWANLEVLKPTIYSRPPVPVVVPRFRDRRPLRLKASELLERSLVTDFDADDIDSTIRLARDDLVGCGRGAVWLRYAEGDGGQRVLERVLAEHVDRKDFLHSPARKWGEVDWVARRSWLTRKAGEARFGEKWRDVQMEERSHGGDEQDYRGEKKGEVWEIWHKTEGAIVWVSPGVEDVLDIRPPILSLDGFFPCPRPVYGTVQRSTLIPVPDYLYYKDQVEEINEMTARISSLAEALRLKGFYNSGAGDVGDAIEAVLKDQSNTAVLVPITNLASLGGGSLKDSIVWLPVREVAEVITNLIQLRRQLIEDVYEITGLSDIMRGQTKASETLGAQQLKAQFGSIRVQDRQSEMVRLARDITRIKAEIMAEQFAPETLLAMSQMDNLPQKQEVEAQIATIKQQVKLKLVQAKGDPEIMARAQANPEEAQQFLQNAQAQVQGQIQELQNTVTIDAVMELLRNERLRPFVLDIETDSTIQPNEDQEKRRRTEFLTAMGSFISQAGPMVAAQPETAPFLAEVLKFTAGGFRAGRQLDDAIDEFAEKIKSVAAQPKPDPAAEAAKAEAEIEKARVSMEGAKVKAEIAKLEAETAQIAQGEVEDTGPTLVEEHTANLDKRKIALEERKFKSDIEQAGLDREAELTKDFLKAGVAPGTTFDGQQQAAITALAEMEDRMAESLKTIGEAAAARDAQIAEALRMLAAAMTAPKRVVRDKSGRAVGIETVTN